MTEWQLVRPDGTVLVSFTFPACCSFSWHPAPGEEITGPCLSRSCTGAGPWIRECWFPEGFPGPAYLCPPEPLSPLDLVVVPDPWVIA